MKAVDRLIVKAKKKCGTESLITGFVCPMGFDSWVARAHIGNSACAGQLRIVTCGQFDSIDAAVDAIHALGEQYPNNKDAVIFIEDVFQ